MKITLLTYLCGQQPIPSVGLKHCFTYTVPKTLEFLIYDTGPPTTIEYLMFAFQDKDTDLFLSVILRSEQLFKDKYK